MECDVIKIVAPSSFTSFSGLNIRYGDPAVRFRCTIPAFYRFIHRTDTSRFMTGVINTNAAKLGENVRRRIRTRAR